MYLRHFRICRITLYTYSMTACWFTKIKIKQRCFNLYILEILWDASKRQFVNSEPTFESLSKDILDHVVQLWFFGHQFHLGELDAVADLDHVIEQMLPAFTNGPIHQILAVVENAIEDEEAWRGVFETFWGQIVLNFYRVLKACTLLAEVRVHGHLLPQ